MHALARQRGEVPADGDDDAAITEGTFEGDHMLRVRTADVYGRISSIREDIGVLLADA